MLTFAEVIASGTLDVTLLAHITQTSRAHIYAWPQKTLTAPQEVAYRKALARLNEGEPLAYLIAKKEFWSMELTVSPATLIPRPETELLIEIILKKFSSEKIFSVLDLGTGSGAIALAIAKEKPDWKVLATDISSEALAVAKANADNLQITNVSFLQSDWFLGLAKQKFSLIVSNPPYLALDDVAIDPMVKAYEPSLALFAKEQGLADFRKIISAAKNFLVEKGTLLVEHGFQQGESVGDLFAQNGYQNIQLYPDLSGHDRVTSGSCD